MTITIDQHTVRAFLEWVIIIGGVLFLAWQTLITIFYIDDQITKYKQKRERMKYSNVKAAALSHLKNRIKAYTIMTEEIGCKPYLYMVYNKKAGTCDFHEVMPQIAPGLSDSQVPGTEEGWFLLIKGCYKDTGFRPIWENHMSKDPNKKFETMDDFVLDRVGKYAHIYHEEARIELLKNLSKTKGFIKYT